MSARDAARKMLVAQQQAAALDGLMSTVTAAAKARGILLRAPLPLQQASEALHNGPDQNRKAGADGAGVPAAGWRNVLIKDVVSRMAPGTAAKQPVHVASSSAGAGLGGSPAQPGRDQAPKAQHQAGAMQPHW